jgi:hypothetical protein
VGERLARAAGGRHARQVGARGGERREVEPDAVRREADREEPGVRVDESQLAAGEIDAQELEPAARVLPGAAPRRDGIRPGGPDRRDAQVDVIGEDRRLARRDLERAQLALPGGSTV